MANETETIAPKYLVFTTEEDGLARATTEGQARNYSYYSNGIGTRYYNSPIPCEDGTWALEVSQYITLTDDEQTVASVSLLTEEDA